MRKRALALDLDNQGWQLAEIPVDRITPNPWQPRRVFDSEALSSLASSIAETGLIEPIVVRFVPSLDKYQLIAGERRLRAHKVLGKETIKAMVGEVDDGTAATMAVAENLDRENLTDYEVALAIRNIELQFKKKTALAESLGIARSDFYRYKQFFRLPRFILDDLDATPSLLGRAAAAQVVTSINAHGEACIPELSKLWTLLVQGKLNQMKLAVKLDLVMTPKAEREEQDVREFFVGKEPAGRFVRDNNKITVELKTGALTRTQEHDLRRFVEQLLGMR